MFEDMEELEEEGWFKGDDALGREVYCFRAKHQMKELTLVFIADLKPIEFEDYEALIRLFMVVPNESVLMAPPLSRLFPNLDAAMKGVEEEFAKRKSSPQ